MSDLQKRYTEYSAILSDLVDIEAETHNKKRILIDLADELNNSEENDGSYGIEFSSHAFYQLSERLEQIAMENPIIHSDVYKEDKCLLSPSNLKSFIITAISNARENGSFKEQDSKNSDGKEFRYTINMKKWSNQKSLKLVIIVEDNKIKSGWFNWV